MAEILSTEVKALDECISYLESEIVDIKAGNLDHKLVEIAKYHVPEQFAGLYPLLKNASFCPLPCTCTSR